MDKYFEKFPIITYGNTQVIDITKRVAVLEKISKNPYVFFPYEITFNERPDQLAARYYEDPYKSWMIYLANKIVDPYYEWYMHSREFDEFLIGKYGDLVRAYDKTYNYRHNWENAENISVSAYNALPSRLRLYWEPAYGNKNNITSYSRRQKNWIINTNKIVSYEISNTSFINDEICNIRFDDNNSGTAQILYTTNNKIYVQHTTGVTLSNSEVEITENSYIYGRESLVNSVFTSSELITENIVDEEEVYWKPITYWEYENEKNEFNKTIRVIDNELTFNVVRDFKNLMSE